MQPSLLTDPARFVYPARLPWLAGYSCIGNGSGESLWRSSVARQRRRR
jgi:hypothetical protein